MVISARLRSRALSAPSRSSRVQTRACSSVKRASQSGCLSAIFLVTIFLRGASSDVQKILRYCSTRSRPAAARAASSAAMCFWSLVEPEPRISISAGHSVSGISEAEKNSFSTFSRLSSGARSKLCDNSAMALSTLPACSIQAAMASRDLMASPITSLKVWSAATTMAVSSACPSALAGSALPSSSTSSVSRSSCCAVAPSSSTVKRAATLASNGNWCSSLVQKAWMVCTFKPPGVSSADANRRRARARWEASGFLPVLSLICSSSA